MTLDRADMISAAGAAIVVASLVIYIRLRDTGHGSLEFAGLKLSVSAPSILMAIVGVLTMVFPTTRYYRSLPPLSFSMPLSDGSKSEADDDYDFARNHVAFWVCGMVERKTHLVSYFRVAYGSLLINVDGSTKTVQDFDGAIPSAPLRHSFVAYSANDHYQTASRISYEMNRDLGLDLRTERFVTLQEYAGKLNPGNYQVVIIGTGCVYDPQRQ